MFFGKPWCHKWLPGWITFKLWKQDTVAIGNPERHVLKASHRGSKQQWRSCVAISLRTPVIMFNRSHVNIGRAFTSQSLLLLLARATHIYFCSSRTSCSWWITQSTQRHRRGCNKTRGSEKNQWWYGLLDVVSWWPATLFKR